MLILRLIRLKLKWSRICHITIKRLEMNLIHQD